MTTITIDDVCRTAWESTRSESAVAYDNLEPDYRAKLIERAEIVLAGEWPAGAWEKFEREVCLLADGRGFMQVGSDKPSLRGVKYPEDKEPRVMILDDVDGLADSEPAPPKKRGRKKSS